MTLQILRGALVVAAVSTLGDFVWAGLRLPHRVVYGLAHGALLFLVIGAVLGAPIDKPRVGALAGGAVGLTAAASFYVLAPFAGYAVMFAVWASVWLALGVLVVRVLPARRGSWREAVTRGAIAMIGAGIGFYAISDIWRPFDPVGWDYAEHFVSWTIAYLPPMASLLLNPASIGWRSKGQRPN